MGICGWELAPIQWWIELSSGEQAGWAQAIGTMFAIFATWVITSNKERKDDGRRNAELARETYLFIRAWRAEIKSTRDQARSLIAKVDPFVNEMLWKLDGEEGSNDESAKADSRCSLDVSRVFVESAHQQARQLLSEEKTLPYITTRSVHYCNAMATFLDAFGNYFKERLDAPEADKRKINLSFDMNDAFMFVGFLRLVDERSSALILAMSRFEDGYHPTSRILKVWHLGWWRYQREFGFLSRKLT